jgi:Amt family ammonium transporter
VWSGVVSFAILMLLKHTIGLRVTQDEEREGLDTVSHGERAYSL